MDRPHPHVTAAIDIARSHQHHLTRPHPRQALKLDHGSDLAGHMRKDRLYMLIRDWFDRFRFLGFGASTLQGSDRLQGVQHGGRDKFVLDTPLEEPPNPVHSLVDVAAAKLLADPSLPDRLERQGTEVHDPVAGLKLRQRAGAAIDKLLVVQARLPVQTRRDQTQIEFQQFSTPPAEALVVVKAAALCPGMSVLEPSAGTGNIAVLARLLGAEVDTNEIDPRRHELLALQGFEPTAFDAERLDNLLPPEKTYHAVVMNPPFSATGGRVNGHRTAFGARHIEQALLRLRAGGRLVASQRKLITVGTVHSQALRLAREVDSQLAPADEERISKLIERFQDFGGAQFDKEFLLAEWTGVVENQGILSWDEYRDAQRTGRGRGLQVRERQAIWKVFQQVYEELADKRLAPWTQICRKAAEAIQTDRVQSPFDAVVIDEVQDLKPQEIRFLAALAAKNPGNLMLIGDAGQRIYPGGYSLRSLGIDVRGRSHVLRINYRTTEQIRRFADRILPESADDLDGGTETRKGTKSLLKGPVPTLRGFTTAKEQDAFIVEQIKRLTAQGLQPREIAVFARIGSRLESLQKTFAAAGIISLLLSRDEDSNQLHGIRLGTMHRAKGLEYKVVFAYDCSEGVVPYMTALRRFKDPADYDAARAREQQLLYVSLTRARDEVFITWAGLPSPFLPDKQEHKDKL